MTNAEAIKEVTRDINLAEINYRSQCNEYESNQTLSNEEHLKYCKARLDTLKVSLEALREKADREKGCEYCKNGAPITDDFMAYSAIKYFESDESAPIISVLQVNSCYQKINFCPMCGRPLKGAT